MTTINIYDGDGDLGAALLRIEEKLDQLTRDLAAFTITEAQSDTYMEDLMSDFDARVASLQAEVAEQTTVNGSAVTLLTNLTADLQALRDDLAANGVTPEQLAAMDAQIASYSDNTDALAAAVEEHTPAAP
jgi:hypothetical protein